MIVFLVTFGLSAAAADCAESVDAQSLAASLAAADAAFAAMDLHGFQRAHDEATAHVECLDEPITPIDAAHLHRVVALGRFVAGDTEGTIRSFQSSLAIQPAYDLPSTVAPDGHPLFDAYDAARFRRPGPETELTQPQGAVVHIDGTRTLTVPKYRPVVVQLLSTTGKVVFTTYLEPGETPPRWDSAPETAWEEPVPAGRGRRIGLVSATAGAAVLGGALYAAALSSRGRFDDRETPYDDLDGLKGRTNALALSAAGAGVVATGLGIYTAVTW